MEGLRKRYRELLKQYRPDNGGNEEVMKEINSAYEAVFERRIQEKELVLAL